MAKKGGESKLALAGTITLGLAIAGVLLVQPPLKSSRPPSLAGEAKPQLAEGVVQARLWEDPLEAARRAVPSDGSVAKSGGDGKDDVDRVRAVRDEIDRKIAQQPGRPLTVLLVMTEGGVSGESRETRLRDRYALGSALGIACYAPEHEDQVSYIEWRDRTGVNRVVPYEWYGEGPRHCSHDPGWAQAVLVMWISSEMTGDRPIGTLQRLTQSLLCEEGTVAACQQAHDGTVLLDLNRERRVRFKIIGPRSSSAFRNFLEEGAGLVQGPDEHLIWANAGGRVELYSPWATAMPKLLTQGIPVSPPPAAATECVSADASRAQLCEILLRSGIELKYSIGSDDQLFDALVQELERRRVKFERDAIILIAEWDSFYGRVMPVEFTAAVCHRIAQRTPEENRAIEPERQAEIRAKCGTYDQAIDLQVNNPVGTRGLGLNLWKYSYLRGLDGEVPGGRNGEGGKEAGTKSLKAALLDNQTRERPIGTSQFDYAQRLAARIERDMAEEANLQERAEGEGSSAGTEAEKPVHKPPAAIGILGSDAYDALLILQAMRERFPGVVFFTTDLDSRLVYADDYRWTRNLVIASHFGLELYKRLQRYIPPFRSSYQTSVYFATLQAVGHVNPLTVCPPDESQSRPARGPLLSPCGYQANLVPDGIWFSGTEPPRLFEVGRHGAVDVTVGGADQGYTLHAPRVDLSNEDPQSSGRRPPSGMVYGTAGLLFLAVLVIGWTRPTINQWITDHPKTLLAGAVATAGLAVVVDRWLFVWALAHHDEGEPFYWLEGVSIWPTELLRVVAMVLAILFVVKAWRDLQRNLTVIETKVALNPATGGAPVAAPASYLSTVLWVLSPRRANSTAHASNTSVRDLWHRYREAGSGRHRLPRLLLLVLVYVAVFVALWKVLGAEDLSGPCRGLFSCRLDLLITLVSYISLVVLNLFVFDAVLLCRRWIGLLAQATEDWTQLVAARFKLESAEAHVKAKELLKMELIAQRTDVVNRMVRYPFIVLLITIAARNEYFDNWHFPVTLLAGWVVNVLLALGAALLLYRAAEEARSASLTRLNHLLLADLHRGTPAEPDVKLTRQVIDDVESVSQGAFVPLWQQPVVESSMYGLLALLQYLYLN